MDTSLDMLPQGEPQSTVPTRVLVALFEAANAVYSDLDIPLPKGKGLALAAAIGRARCYLPRDHPAF